MAFIAAAEFFIGVLTAAGVGTAAATAIVAVGIAVAAVTLIGVAQKALSPSQPNLTAEASEIKITVRSTTEPRRVVYGETAVSGPIHYMNTSAAENQRLSEAVILAGHQVNAIGDVWLDDEVITVANWNAGTGEVIGGFFRGDVAFASPVFLRKHLGTITQLSDSGLVAFFTEYTAAHQLKGIAHVVLDMSFFQNQEAVWEKGFPSSIYAIVQGKLLYDPRLDSTMPGGAGLHRLTDPNTWEWSDNPALCAADYLKSGWTGNNAVDPPIAMRKPVDPNKIDWAMLASAADDSDVLVAIPTASTEKRFTCNGSYNSLERPRRVMNRILSSMFGNAGFIQGKWRIRAGVFAAGTITLTADDLRGAPKVQAETPARDRWNAVSATYIDPARKFEAVESIEQSSAEFVTRDNGFPLPKTIETPFTNTETMAQRVALRYLELSDLQTTCVFPANYKGLKVGVGSRVAVTIDELSWAAKTFVCTNWKFREAIGIDLVLREDIAAAYTDPLEADYATRTAAGVINFPTEGVPQPSGLTAMGFAGGVDLQWTNGASRLWELVDIYAAADNIWANRVKIGESKTNRFTHPHEGNDARTRGYWVQARNVNGNVSTRFPDLDTTNVVGTAQAAIGGDEISGVGVIYRYDDLDTTGEVTGDGHYALLSNLSVTTSGIQSAFETAVGLLIRDVDTDVVNRATYYNNLKVGNRVTYYISDARWFEFEITSLETTVLADRHLFGIEIRAFDEPRDAPVQPTVAGNDVQFQFNLSPLFEREFINGIPVGVTGDLLFFKNMDVAGVNQGEIRVRGTYIQDPATDVKKSFNRGDPLARVATAFEGASGQTDAAYVMWTDEPGNDRFTTITLLDNHELVLVEYDNATQTWRARDNGSGTENFTPLSTDILLAKIVRLNSDVGGGIDLLQSFVNYQPGDDLIKTDLFTEDFTGRDMEARYIEAEVSTPQGTVTYVEAGDVGGVVLQVAGGRRWMELDRLFPFNPALLYKFTVKVRQTVAGAVNGVFYMGFAGIAQDGITRIATTGLNTAGNSHYVAALNEDLDALFGLNTWHTFVGYLKGHDNANNLNSREDPFDPAHAETGIAYFRPQFIMNHSVGDGTMQIDYYKVEVIQDLDIPDIGQSGLIADPQFNRTVLDGTFWRIVPGDAGSAITVEKDIGVTGNVVRVVVVTAGQDGSIQAVPHRIHSTVTTGEQVRVTARWRRTTAVTSSATGIIVSVFATNADFTDTVTASPTAGISVDPSAATINEWQEITGIFNIQNNPKNVLQVPFISVTLFVNDIVNGTIEWDSVQVRSI